MHGVQACVRSHLHRFLILNAHIHLSGRLYFGPFIEEADVIKPRKGKTCVVVVFVLQFLLRPVKIELIFLFILFFCDFADFKSCSFVQSALRGDCCVDVVIPALCVQDSTLRKQLLLRIRGNFSPGLVSYPRTGVLRIRFRYLCSCRLSVLRISGCLRGRRFFFSTYFHGSLRLVLSVVFFAVTLSAALFRLPGISFVIDLACRCRITCRLHFYPGLLLGGFLVQGDRGEDHRIRSCEHNNTR